MPNLNTPVKITFLIDNSPGLPHLFNEHGLSIWIQTPTHNLLFDAGPNHHTSDNASSLGIDLASAHAIVLSHGHYDHTAGLAHLLAASPIAPVFFHPAALSPRFSRKQNGSLREIGMPPDVAQNLRLSPSVSLVSHPSEILPGLFASGPIPRLNNFEDTGGQFFLDPAGRIVDPIDDDQALYFQSPRGLVILLGCAHAGLINTIQHIRTLANNQPLHAVLGGMHLRSASPHRIAATLQALQNHNPNVLAPAHCTGEHAINSFRKTFPGRVFPCHVGSHWTFD